MSKGTYTDDFYFINGRYGKKTSLTVEPEIAIKRLLKTAGGSSGFEGAKV